MNKVSLDYAEDYTKFSSQMADLVAKHNGSQMGEKWFNKCQENHQPLRQKLGGIRFVRDISIKGLQRSADQSSCENLTEVLFDHIPNLSDKMDKEGIEYDELLKPSLKVKGKIVRTGKCLLRWFDDEHSDKKRWGYDGKKKLVIDTIAKIGQEWSKARSEQMSAEVTLTTSAIGFILLGHYLVDDESCFGQDGGHEEDKAILGQSKNTYVVLIRQNGKIISRGWGFTNSAFTNWSVSNFYYKEGLREGNVIKILTKFFQELRPGGCNNKLKTYHPRQEKTFIPDGVYGNGDALTFSFQKTMVEATFTAEEDLGFEYCPKCDIRFDIDEGCKEMDGEKYCQSCSNEIVECPVSHENYLKDELLEGFYKGKRIMVGEGSLQDSCEKCCIPCDEQSLKIIKLKDYNSNLCPDCLEEFKDIKTKVNKNVKSRTKTRTSSLSQL